MASQGKAQWKKMAVALRATWMTCTSLQDLCSSDSVLRIETSCGVLACVGTYRDVILSLIERDLERRRHHAIAASVGCIVDRQLLDAFECSCRFACPS